jgi:DNA processing protein
MKPLWPLRERQSPFWLVAWTSPIRRYTRASSPDAVLVVEAPEGSGSLTTAHAANELGKQVFVVPANISSQGFRGSHDLIRQGATLVDHPDQILEDLGIERSLKKKPETQVHGMQAVILAALGDDPIPPEKIAAQTGLDASALLSELTLLELDGKVVRALGGYARSL